jgi:hypothetical protein
MENFTFSKLMELVSCEATYRTIALAMADAGGWLSRADFLSERFTIEVTCDGLIALARLQQPARLILQRVPRPNGRQARR